MCVCVHGCKGESWPKFVLSASMRTHVYTCSHLCVSMHVYIYVHECTHTDTHFMKYVKCMLLQMTSLIKRAYHALVIPGFQVQSHMQFLITSFVCTMQTFRGSTNLSCKKSIVTVVCETVETSHTMFQQWQ